MENDPNGNSGPEQEAGECPLINIVEGLVQHVNLLSRIVAERFTIIEARLQDLEDAAGLIQESFPDDDKKFWN